MLLKKLISVLSLVMAPVAVSSVAMASETTSYATHSKAEAFLQKMVKEHGFTREAITSVLAQAEKKQSILDAIARPAEKTKPWHEYRNIFLGADRVAQGVAFWEENADTLSKVSEQYGVAPEIIVAIIGVETRYGRYMGSYRVIDALTTLGFDYPPRSKFFTSQLEAFFLLTKEQQQNPLKLMGSYAGAMGYGQFIPSSYRRYARDYDGDGVADIWNNKQDAIASVANYFKAHGWQNGKQVLLPVTLPSQNKPTHEAFNVNTGSRPSMQVSQWQAQKLVGNFTGLSEEPAVLLEYDQPDGPEYLLGFNNFYVITRYNRSHMYARAVWELSKEVLALRKQQINSRSS